MSNGPTEPSSDIRRAASTMWQLYAALTAEGFSEDQALRIVANMLKSDGGS